MPSDKAQSDLTSEVDRAIAEWFANGNLRDEPQKQELLHRYPRIESELRAFFSDYGRFRDNAVASLDPNGDHAAPSDLSPTKLFDGDTTESVAVSARYRELRLYRQGGLGVLYSAADESLHRDSVVKFLSDKGQDDSTFRKQFQIEAEITARLDHPGVVPVYGIGEDWKGRPFYVMRMIKGRELTHAINEYHASRGTGNGRNQNRRELFGLLEHLVRACNTVAYAHDVGIIHCDLKPANIMIGKYGETFVLDWGLAQLFERTSAFHRSEPTMRPRSVPDSTSSGHRGGTLGYMSPEQLDPDQPIGPATDIYSLGATLYQILTGAAPFNGRDRNVIDLIRSGKFQRPRSGHKRISPSLEAICLKALSLNPRSRYSTAKMLAADLDNWMRDDEIQARPDRWHQRIARYSRRHRAMTVAGVIWVILLCAGASWRDRTVRIAEHDRMVQTCLSTAIDTFEDLCRPLANGEMNNLSELKRISSPIKDFTADYLKQFETNRSMRPHTGRVYELSAIIERVDSPETMKAIRRYEQAEQIYRDTSIGEASGIDVQRRIAQIRLSQGQLYLQRHEYDRAHQLLGEADEMFEAAIKHDPQNAVLRRELAEVHHSRGETYLDQDFAMKALLYFEKSRDARIELEAKSDPDHRSAYTRDLARSYGYLGDLFLKLNNAVEAVKNYELSKQKREILFNSNNSDPEHRFQYARGIANFGFYERGYGGRLDKAIENLLPASELQRRLSLEFADVVKFKRELGGTLAALAEVYLFRATQASPPDAADLKKCLEYIDQAEEEYGILYARKNTPLAQRGAFELAACYVIEASAVRSENPNRSRELAEKAEKLLREFQEPETLLQQELVTLALAKGLQGDPSTAFKFLEKAVLKGENEVFRLEAHKNAGFQSIAHDDRLRTSLDRLCDEVRRKLRFE